MLYQDPTILTHIGTSRSSLPRGHLLIIGDNSKDGTSKRGCGSVQKPFLSCNVKIDPLVGPNKGKNNKGKDDPF